ncbi:unnamed protein product [Prunus armeniaca]
MEEATTTTSTAATATSDSNVASHNKDQPTAHLVLAAEKNRQRKQNTCSTYLGMHDNFSL